MSTNDQPSTNSLPEQTTKHRISNNKVKNQFDEGLAQINEQNNGNHTSTPVRPPVGGEPQPALENPEPAADSDAKNPQGFKFTRMMLAIGVVVMVLVAATITAVVIYVTRNKVSIIVETEFITNQLASPDARMQIKRISVKDPQGLNSTTPLKIYGRRVLKSSRRVTNTKNSNGNRLLAQEDEQAYASFSFKDQATNTVFTLQSKDMQLRASFDISKVLAKVIDAQQPQNSQESQRSLQQSESQTPASETTYTKDFSFNNIGEQIANKLKEKLMSSDANVQVQQQITHNIEYNNQTSTFQFTSATSSLSSAESVTFYNPAETPKVSDPNNQAQLANAVSSVMAQTLLQARKFFAKIQVSLQSAAQISLPQFDPSNGTSSFYLDKPEDFGKQCTPIGDNAQQCENNIVGSNLINVAPPKGGDSINPNTNVIVHIDF